METRKAAVGIIRNEFREILVGERPSSKRLASPGGKIEKDETPEEALKREMKEETDITCEEIELYDVKVVGSENDRWQIWITKYSGTIKNMEPDKCLGWQFMKIEQIEHRPMIHSLQHIIHETKFRDMLDSKRE
jgi:mutator protein MutT